MLIDLRLQVDVFCRVPAPVRRTGTFCTVGPDQLERGIGRILPTVDLAWGDVDGCAGIDSKGLIAGVQAAMARNTMEYFRLFVYVARGYGQPHGRRDL